LPAIGNSSNRAGGGGRGGGGGGGGQGITSVSSGAGYSKQQEAAGMFPPSVSAGVGLPYPSVGGIPLAGKDGSSAGWNCMPSHPADFRLDGGMDVSRGGAAGGSKEAAANGGAIGVDNVGIARTAGDDAPAGRFGIPDDYHNPPVGGVPVLPDVSC